jgi:hypothetical protein
MCTMIFNCLHNLSNPYVLEPLCKVPRIILWLLRTNLFSVSGYGKTHLARVYTRHNKGIYIKFSERQSTNYFYKAIHTMINGLQRKYLPVNIDQRTGENYFDFTEKAGQAIEIFFLAAIEHYIYFYYMSKSLHVRHSVI